MQSPPTIPFVLFEPGKRGTHIVERHTVPFADLPTALDHKVLPDKDARQLLAFADYRPGATRGKEGIEHLHAIVLDFDGCYVGDLDLVDKHLRALGRTYWLYSAWSHRDVRKVLGKDELAVSGPFDSFRVVLPLERPATPDEWERIYPHVVAEILPPWFAERYPKPLTRRHPQRGLDPASERYAQGWFAPCAPAELEEFALSDIVVGQAIEVDHYLARTSPGGQIVLGGKGPIERVHAAMARKGIEVLETSPGQFNGCCPAHEELNPSFGYTTDETGTVWLSCFAGCEKSDILTALGLSFKDLFPADPRTEIDLTLKEYVMVERAVEALAKDERLFHRRRELVTVAVDESALEVGAQIFPVKQPAIRTRLTRVAKFMVTRLTKDGDEQRVEVEQPKLLSSQIAAEGEWPQVRPLEGLLQAPTLRVDGSLLNEPGYDAPTRYYLARTLPVQVPERPTRSDAMAAKDVLLDLVCDFPFASDVDRSVWLALVLTRACRRAVEGSTPLFAIDAPTRGTGKSMLAELACAVTLGRRQVPTTWPKGNDEELRKLMLAAAVDGADCMFFDNVKDTMGGGPVEMAITACAINGRVLGSTKTAEAPFAVTWVATGNNLDLTEDLARRSLICRMDANRPDPENRSGFKYASVLEHVCANHARYLSAALTLLRAFMVAGKPRTLGSRRLGSFEAWSDTIAGAVMWVGMPDPVATQARQRAEAPDDEAAGRAAVLRAILALQDTKPEGVYLRDLVAADVYQTFREAVESCVNGRGPAGALTTQQVAELLKRCRARVAEVDGEWVKLTGKTDRTGATRWSVEVVRSLAAE